MKKLIMILLPAVLLIALVLGSIILMASMRYYDVQYDKDTRAHFLSLAEGGTLTAEYDGVKVQVSAENSGRIWRVLSISEMKRKFTAPEYDESGAVLLDFSDGAHYRVFEDPDTPDGVFIHYTNRGHDLWFSCSGYNQMEWLLKCIAPDGFYGDNTVIA